MNLVQGQEVRPTGEIDVDVLDVEEDLHGPIVEMDRHGARFPLDADDIDGVPAVVQAADDQRIAVHSNGGKGSALGAGCQRVGARLLLRRSGSLDPEAIASRLERILAACSLPAGKHSG